MINVVEDHAAHCRMAREIAILLKNIFCYYEACHAPSSAACM